MSNYCIVNDDELSAFLAFLMIKKIAKKKFKNVRWAMVNKMWHKHYTEQNIILNAESREKILKIVNKDLIGWVDDIKYFNKKNHRMLASAVYSRMESIFKSLGEGDPARGRRLLLEIWSKFNYESNIRSLAKGLFGKQARWRTPETYKEIEEPCLVRNILNNESTIKTKMDNNFPFIFIDSGYTNFVRGGISNKQWHRVVKDGIHHGDKPNHVFPTDRLVKMIQDNRKEISNFKFPKHWRVGGHKVIIIPPSGYIARIENIDVDKWIKRVSRDVSKHAPDKEVVVRDKTPVKKLRRSLYEDLREDPTVYCVIHHNSNAGTEAIWAGVPIITLGKHVTRSVSRHSIEEINDLYRGDVAQWLCYLSYSQFTYDEIVNGTAKKILELWHV